jgi:hypothetical protein
MAFERRGETSIPNKKVIMVQPPPPQPQVVCSHIVVAKVKYVVFTGPQGGLYYFKKGDHGEKTYLQSYQKKKKPGGSKASSNSEDDPSSVLASTPEPEPEAGWNAFGKRLGIHSGIEVTVYGKVRAVYQGRRNGRFTVTPAGNPQPLTRRQEGQYEVQAKKREKGTKLMVWNADGTQAGASFAWERYRYSHFNLDLLCGVEIRNKKICGSVHRQWGNTFGSFKAQLNKPEESEDWAIVLFRQSAFTKLPGHHVQIDKDLKMASLVLLDETTKKRVRLVAIHAPHKDSARIRRACKTYRKRLLEYEDVDKVAKVVMLGDFNMWPSALHHVFSVYTLAFCEEDDNEANNMVTNCGTFVEQETKNPHNVTHKVRFATLVTK